MGWRAVHVECGLCPRHGGVHTSSVARRMGVLSAASPVCLYPEAVCTRATWAKQWPGASRVRESKRGFYPSPSGGGRSAASDGTAPLNRLTGHKCQHGKILQAYSEVQRHLNWSTSAEPGRVRLFWNDVKMHIFQLFCPVQYVVSAPIAPESDARCARQMLSVVSPDRTSPAPGNRQVRP